MDLHFQQNGHLGKRGVILLFALGKHPLKGLILTVVQSVGIGVSVGADQIAFGGGLPQDQQGHIGAMVGNTLQIGQKFAELGAQFDGTAAWRACISSCSRSTTSSKGST